MARPIKETPVLEGEEARLFFEKAEKTLTDKTGRVSKEEYERTKTIYEKVMNNSKVKF